MAVEALLAHSEDLARAWLLKEDFYRFLQSKDSNEAKKKLDQFCYSAKKLQLPEFEPLLKTLKNWELYILNSFDCPYSNGFTEGTNNSIKVLKRATYGMPNFRNFRVSHTSLLLEGGSLIFFYTPMIAGEPFFFRSLTFLKRKNTSPPFPSPK